MVTHDGALWLLCVLFCCVGGVSECQETVNYATNKDKSINAREFESCLQLVTIIIDDEIEYIRSHAFHQCTNLVTVNLSASLKTVREYAFSHCTKLQSLVFQEGLELVGVYAFRGTTALEELHLPSTLTSFGMFAICCSGPNLRIYLDEGCQNYTVINNELMLTKNKTILIACSGRMTVSSFTTNLPAETHTLGEGCCAGTLMVGTVRIPEQVKTIRNRIFADTTTVTVVNFSKNVESIAEGVFTYAQGMTAINVWTPITSGTCLLKVFCTRKMVMLSWRIQLIRQINL